MWLDRYFWKASIGAGLFLGFVIVAVMEWPKKTDEDESIFKQGAEALPDASTLSFYKTLSAPPARARPQQKPKETPSVAAFSPESNDDAPLKAPATLSPSTEKEASTDAKLLESIAKVLGEETPKSVLKQLGADNAKAPE